VNAPAPDLLREVLAGAWGSRYAIETEASLRFGALAQRLQAIGAPAALVDLAARASSDETRHAAHCERIFHGHGGETLQAVDRVIEYAPRNLPPTERLTYEMVAQCCVAETQSMTTLVTLLEAVETPDLRTVLHELARDEVNHSRLGWAYLAWARPHFDFGFLEALLPGMISGSAGPDLFTVGSPASNDPALLAQGVVPRSMRQRLYLETMETVVLPGFDTLGVATGLARVWVAEKRLGAGLLASDAQQ
jgi:hypothetical protein